MPLRPEVFKAWPPDGWKFFQPQTQWYAPFPLQFTFQQQVQNIIKMRQANPRFGLQATYPAVAKELENYTCNRIGNDPKYCLPVEPNDTDPQKKTTHTSLPSPLAAVAEEGKVRIALLAGWLGDGGTAVAQETAESRSKVCVDCRANTLCPKFDPSKTPRLGWIIGPAVWMIRQYLKLKNGMKLATSNDEGLGQCYPCLCELKLKVWVPKATIIKYIEPEVIVALSAANPACWVVKDFNEGP